MMCNKNVGKLDKLLRILLAAGLAGVSFFYMAPPLAYLALLIGLILLLTAVLGVDPVYCIFGINTLSVGIPEEKKAVHHAAVKHAAAKHKPSHKKRK
ncbi:MAG: DUF2892 domain-containing protein [archaeon]